MRCIPGLPKLRMTYTALLWFRFSLVLLLLIVASTRTGAMTTPSRRSFPAATRSSSGSNPPTNVWNVRPATPNDKGAVEALLRVSYSTLLQADYEEQILETALPIICQANDQLLTSSTWYVAEHHLSHGEDDKQATILIGCGGWTPYSPMQQEDTRQGVGRAIWDRIWKDWVTYHHHVSTMSSTTNPSEHDESTNPTPAGTKTTTASNTVSAFRPDMEVISTLSAQSFYKSLGFVKVKDMVVPLSDNKCPFPAILMRRPDSGCEQQQDL
jgi:hypothetical protein